MENAKNARFWFWHCDGYVKLTMQPGDTIETWEGGRTDEGWRSRSTRFEYDGEVVTMEVAASEVDCDGKMDRFTELSCPVADLRSEHYADFEHGLPNWSKEHASQRDYAAEAAGY